MDCKTHIDSQRNIKQDSSSCTEDKCLPYSIDTQNIQFKMSTEILITKKEQPFLCHKLMECCCKQFKPGRGGKGEPDFFLIRYQYI